MNNELIMPIICGSVIFFLYCIYFYLGREKIHEDKKKQISGTMVALVVEGLAIWRGTRYLSSNPGAQVSSDFSPLLLFFLWLCLAVAGGISILFYMQAFYNIITPWSNKSSKTP